MITKLELRQYESSRKNINAIQQQLNELRLWIKHASPKSPALDGMPRSSGECDAMSRLLIQEESLLHKYQTSIWRAQKQLGKIEKEIEKLEPEEQLLIRLKYLTNSENQRTWEGVAKTMGMAIRTALRLHGTILEKLKK